MIKESGQCHTVNFGISNEEGIPSCTCQDWKRHHVPCKHFFAIFRCQTDWQWERLPLKYLEGPYLSTDNAALESITTSTENFMEDCITTSIEKEKPDVSIEIPTQVRKTNPHVHVYHCMYMYTITYASYLRNKFYILRNTQSL